ncbi:ZIP family zinc transporter [Rathayibacter sp. VKM Ac-2929]|uniref:ZIP family metal transporter n=1 Tax=Rathayibacter sp. VKM Ac-2929 TaxID=2929480 RepID=UPI001FB3C814|nr:ZIP family zinc transporter [Rathayibacter sp. VKM Ac-2929]MCJ1675001.1 ZIP family zinc transporter [Rathayibacter sp. VKM Ac-2929]
MPPWSLALLSGAIGGATLLVGAALAWFVRVPPKLTAAISAFGAGVLISALAYELVQEAADDGGLLPTILGTLAGAVVFVGADALLTRAGAGDRKSAKGSGSAGGGTAIAAGALIDGIPESIVLGLSVAQGGAGAAISVPIVAAVAISNLPEGLSSTVGMKTDGRSARYVFTVWGGIAALSAIAALVGFLVFASAPGAVVAFVTTVAAGAILAMISNTMIPEAFDRDDVLTGLYAVLGFVTAFALHSAS